MSRMNCLSIGIVVLGCLCLAVVSCSDTSGDSTRAPSSMSEGNEQSIASAIANDPNNPDLYYQRARLSYEAGNYADATYDLARAMELDSINEEYHHLLSDVYLGAFDSEMALRTMERAQRLFPESKKTNLKMAELLIILKQYEQASASLQRVMDVEPLNIEALQLLGVLYKERGDLDNAIKSFRRVVEIDGDNSEGWTMLGNLLDIQGDPSALQCFENAITIDSTYAQGWHSKAFYLQNHGDIPQAIDIYLKIQSFEPEYLDAYLNAGILYLEQEENDKAKEQFGQLIELNPTDALGNYYMAVAFEASGELEDALRYYNKAASLSPRNARFGEAVERVRIALNR